MLACGWALCCGTWALYLLAFWPGIMTEDSIDQWTQAQRGVFRDEHPAVHTLLIWLITRLWNSPAAVALLQIVLVASLLALIGRDLLRLAVPRRLVAALLALAAVSPVNGLMTITLWKDIPYSATLLALFWWTIRLVSTRGDRAGGTPGAFTLGLLLFFLSSLRHNGQFVAVGFIVGAALVWRESWRRFAAIGLCSAAAVILVRGPLFRVLDVTPAHRYWLLQNQTHQLAAILHEGVVLSPQQMAVVSGVMPIDEWRRSYVCCSVMPTLARGNQAFVASHWKEYLRVVWDLAVRHPGPVLRRQLCVTSAVWWPGELEACPLFTHYPGIVPNQEGLRTEAKVAPLAWRLAWVARATETRWVKAVVWRPAVYLYLHLVLIALAARRWRRRDLLAVLLPAGVNAVVLLALNTVQDFRFHYGLYLIAGVSPGLLFAGALARSREAATR